MKENKTMNTGSLSDVTVKKASGKKSVYINEDNMWV